MQATCGPLRCEADKVDSVANLYPQDRCGGWWVWVDGTEPARRCPAACVSLLCPALLPVSACSAPLCSQLMNPCPPGAGDHRRPAALAGSHATGEVGHGLRSGRLGSRGGGLAAGGGVVPAQAARTTDCLTSPRLPPKPPPAGARAAHAAHPALHAAQPRLALHLRAVRPAGRHVAGHAAAVAAAAGAALHRAPLVDVPLCAGPPTATLVLPAGWLERCWLLLRSCTAARVLWCCNSMALIGLSRRAVCACIRTTALASEAPHCTGSAAPHTCPTPHSRSGRRAGVRPLPQVGQRHRQLAVPHPAAAAAADAGRLLAGAGAAVRPGEGFNSMATWGSHGWCQHAVAWVPEF